VHHYTLVTSDSKEEAEQVKRFLKDIVRLKYRGECLGCHSQIQTDDQNFIQRGICPDCGGNGLAELR